ncbi:30S ribosomal protein S9 [candidate division SR1 bacterium Aalborg_AAW-1]|nr:30S ribosomal protein S9 [candidate division SR1 bacterium Aalborg_AAW-1]
MSQYNYSIGRRKESTAVVKLYPQGSGKFTVNHNGKQKTLKEYFGGAAYLYENALTPFSILGKDVINQYDAEITVSGGGIAGQSNSIRLGFAKALTESNPEWRLTLKPYGMLVRDARIKERKKPGLKKARKAPTWSKR